MSNLPVASDMSLPVLAVECWPGPGAGGAAALAVRWQAGPKLGLSGPQAHGARAVPPAGLRAPKADSKSELGSYSDPTRSVHGIIPIKRGCRVSGQLQFNAA